MKIYTTKYTTITLILFLYATSISQQVPNVKNSWLGQDSPFTASFVPQGMEGMCVGADGTVYTNVPWEEGGGNFAEIKNGVVNHGEASHGWGAGGGSDVASNSTYVYWAMYMGNEGGGLVGSGAQIDRWPPAGRNWLGVTRRLKSNVKQGAPFAGGKGWPLNSMLAALDYPEGDLREPWINGLHATETELFVSIGSLNIVKVYNATTMVFLREFSVPNPHQIATDSWGKIWVAQGFDATTINRYNPDGSLLPEAINLPTGSFVGDFCIGADDKMYIGDVGRREQVLIYTTIDTYPRETSTFGAMYGIHSGISGRNAPLKFQQIRGIGLDNSGNIYIGNTQWHTGGQGTLVEKYNLATGTMAWKATCVMFVDAVGLDALTEGKDAYGKVERFSIDYSKPVGQEASYVAYTIDRYKYPADPRLWQSMANVQTINFRGKKFLAMMDMTGRIIALFRFNKDTDGEIAIPCIVWGERVNPNYPGSIDKQWIWRDTDGDGQMEAGEYTQQDTYFIDGGRGTYFDTNGDIWQAGWQNLLLNKCLGLDANGIPFYNGSRTLIPAPVPFNDVKRSYYDPKLDRMYLSGRTTNEPGQFDWMTMGRAIVRYDNWSTGNRVAQSELRLPYSNNGGIADPISFCVVKDYIFVCFVGGDNIIPRQQINIYRVSDNSYVGYIRPIFSGVGLFDMNQSINVSLRKNGEYVIVAEENGRNKNLLYRWCPDGTCVETPDIVVANNNYLGFPHPQSTNVLSVTSNVNWTFTGIPSWLTLNTLTGNGNKIINFTASANLGPSRTAEITLTGGGVLWNKITVFQQVDDLSAPTNVTTVFGTFIDTDNFILNWTESSDNVMVVGYEIYKDNILVKTIPGLNTVIVGLNPSTNYNMKVIAFDERGNKLAGTSKIIRTKNITYPYITSKDHANYNVDEKAFDGITWSYWKDWEIQSWIQIQYEFPVVWNKYTLWNLPNGEWTIDDDPKDWVLVGSNDGVTYTTLSTQVEQMWSSRESAKDFYFTNTTAYTRYKFVFNAVRGGRSVGLGEIIFANAPLVDTEPPMVPTALASSQITPNTANLSWQPSTDNVGVFGYEIFRNGVSIGSSTGTNFAVTGLTPSTAYTFTVRAYDFKGNFSAQSAATTFTTRVAPTLSLNLNALNFISTGGSQSISVTSNGIWTVSGLPTWLSANPATDFGNATTSIVATANSNLGARSCVITISSWAAMAIVTITQDGTLPILVVNPTSLTYSSVASAQTLSITSNINWTVSGLPTWLSESTSSGFGSRNISVNTQLNSIAGIRIAQVTISGGAITQIVNITQTGANANLIANPTILTYPSGGSSQNISITSNVTWTSTSSQPWLTLTGGSGTNNGTISATATANTATGIRIAQVTISGGALTQIVNITQTGAAESLVANPTTLTYPSAGSMQNISITSNLAWTSTSSQSWLTLANGNGTNNGIILATASPNVSTAIRTAQVTVSGGTLTQIVNITQTGAAESLVANPTTLTYPSAGSLQNISITSNLAWTSTSSQPWLTLANGNGTNNGIILATASPNVSTAIRTAQVTISGGALTQIVNITQTGAMPSPNLSISKIDIANCGGTGSITLTGSGGGMPYQFSLDNFLTVNNSATPSFVFSNLAAGTYTGYIRNSVSPFYGTSVTGIVITTPIFPNIVTITASDITNCGLEDGSISVLADQGTGVLEYSINNSWSTNISASGLMAGLYQIKVRNQNSQACSVVGTGNININQPNTPNNLMINQILGIQNCDGSLGSIVLSAVFSPQTNLRYSLDGIDWTNQTGTFTGLSAGINYRPHARNLNAIACSLSGNSFISVTTPSIPTISGTVLQHISACGLLDGSITINATGGTGAMEYSTNNFATTTGTNNIAGLSDATYSIYLRNINSTSCIASLSGIVLTAPGAAIAGNIAGAGQNTCAGFSNTLTLTGSAGTIQWQSSTNSATGFGNVGGNTSTLNTGTLTQTTYYIAILSNGTCATQTTTGVAITINQILTPSVSISADKNTICSGTGVTFTITSQLNQGLTPIYTWLLDNAQVGSGTSYTHATLANNQVVKLELTSSEQCVSSPTATSLGVVMSVNPVLIPSVTIVGSANNFCSGSLASVSYTASGFNLGNSPIYRWKNNLNNLGSNSIYTNNSLANAQSISVEMVSNATCANPATVTSNILVMTVNSIPSAPTAGVFGAVCINSTPNFDLTATGTSLKWYANNVAVSTITAPNVNTASTGTTTGFVSQTSAEGCESASRTQVSAVVNGLPVVSLSTSNNFLCENDNTTLLGTGAITYTWSNSSSTFSTQVVAPSVGNNGFTVTGTSNGCSSMAMITVTVISKPLNNLTVTSPQSIVCEGNTVSVVVQGSEIGVSYQAKIGSINQGAAQNGGSDLTFTGINLSNNGLNTVLVEASKVGCSVVAMQANITRNPIPNSPEFSYNNGLPICSNLGTSGQPSGSNLNGGKYSSTTMGIGSISENSGVVNFSTQFIPKIVVDYIIPANPNQGCPEVKGSAVITITNYPGKPAISYENTEFCKTGNINAPAITVTGGKFSSNLALNNDGSMSNLASVASGTYKINYSVAGVGGCLSQKADEVTIKIKESQVTNLSVVNPVICSGSNNLLNLPTSNGILTLQYNETENWQDVSTVIGNSYTTPNLNVSRRYRIAAKLDNCESVYSNDVEIKVDQPTTFSGINAALSEICSEETTEVEIQGAEADSYSWFMSKDSLNFAKIESTPLEPNISVDKNILTTPKIPLGNYGLESTRYYYAKIKNGACKEVLTDTVKVLKCEIKNFSANALTPDANNINSTWDLSSMRLLNRSTVKVFNRYGVEVFSANGSYFNTQKWDGGGLPAGTYYYIIDRNDGVNTDPIKGDLTIVK